MIVYYEEIDENAVKTKAPIKNDWSYLNYIDIDNLNQLRSDFL